MKINRYLKKPDRVVANRRKDEKRLTAVFIGILGLLTLILLYFYPRSAPSRSIIHLEGRTILNNRIKAELAAQGFSEIQIESDESSSLILAFKIPGDMTVDAAVKMIGPLVQRDGCSVRHINRFANGRGFIAMVDYYNQSLGAITFLSDVQPRDYYILKGELRQKPKLAIIIDDFGYSNNDVIRGFIRLNEKLTFSVIPGHPYSRWTAAEGSKHNKEILIHMPMEPERTEYKTGEDQYMIRLAMRRLEVEERIAAALMELPEAVGMNNHMGSLATADNELMNTVMKSLREKGLFFVDSFTSPRSVAYEAARSQGLPAACRSVFLDNQRDKSAIQAQLEKAIEVAKRRGSAIAIGHVYPETLEVLEELIETGKFAGITLCFASEIVS